MLTGPGVKRAKVHDEGPSPGDSEIQKKTRSNMNATSTRRTLYRFARRSTSPPRGIILNFGGQVCFYHAGLSNYLFFKFKVQALLSQNFGHPGILPQNACNIDPFRVHHSYALPLSNSMRLAPCKLTWNPNNHHLRETGSLQGKQREVRWRLKNPAPLANIGFNPTTTVGSKMGGAFTYLAQNGINQNGFDNSQIKRPTLDLRLRLVQGRMQQQLEPGNSGRLGRLGTCFVFAAPINGPAAELGMLPPPPHFEDCNHVGVGSRGLAKTCCFHRQGLRNGRTPSPMLSLI